jgi:uncharacterized damage-inducible protein DinB
VTTKAAQQELVSAKLIERWEQAGRKLAALAEEFPEKKYDYKPIDDVRGFADVLRHVAFWNRFVADSAGGRKTEETANELPRSEYSTKAQIIDALKRTAADAASALKEHSAGLDEGMSEMVVAFIEHTCEHYGQLVVYARLNGIVPPASRS